MKRRLVSISIALSALITPTLSEAQQKPLVTIGGVTKQLPPGTTLGAQPSTSSSAGINIPQGVAPTSPTNGDCWTTSGGYFCKINGITFNLAQAQLGNSAGTVGSMGVNYKIQDSSFQPESMGGYWPTPTWTGYAISKEFTAVNTDAGIDDGPANALMTVGYANGTRKDVVSLMAVSVAHTDNSNVFGANIIATADRAIANGKFVGAEIDLQPPNGSTIRESGGLFVNVFGSALSGAIQTGANGGGSWSAGLYCDGISASGPCVAGVGGAVMGSMINTTTTTFNQAAVILGTGTSQSVQFGATGGNNSPRLYGDTGGTLNLQTGTSGNLSISSPTGEAAAQINSPSNNFSTVQFHRGGLPRWSVGKNANGESGSNVGSDFFISRYNDAGTTIDAPLSISRSTGVVSLATALPLTSGGTGSTTASAARTALGLGTAATQNIGTSGSNVPLLSGGNTWGASQTITGSLILNSSAGIDRGQIVQTSGVTRWQSGSNGAIESGSNTGSDYTINRFNDSGVYIDTPLTIYRTSGNATFQRDVTLGSNLNTGIGVTTGDTMIEVGGLRTGNGYASIDLHATTGTDFETRIIRTPGPNGSAYIQNIGTGYLSFQTGVTSGSLVDRFSIDSSGNSGFAGNLTVSNNTTSGTFTTSGKSFTGSINASNVASNWIETLRPASTQIAQSISVNSGGYIGHLSASRSGDNTCTGGCMGTIGYEAIVHNNNTTAGQVQYAYGAYIEAIKENGAGGTHGMEIDVRNKAPLVVVRPDNPFVSGSTPGLWLASGAGYSENDNSVALGIVSNGTKWDKGIMFEYNGITSRSDTLKEALSLAGKHAVTWRDSNGDILGNIYSSGEGDGTTSANLAFDSGNAAVFVTANGTGLLRVAQDRTIAYTPVILPNYVVSALPTCSSDKKGAMATAIDLTAITYNGNPTGGGSLAAPVFCNGTSWTIH